MTKVLDKERSHTFTLTEPQLRIIFNALEEYTTDTLLSHMEIAKKEDDKEQVIDWEEDLEICTPMYEYFKALYFIVEGMPESEPVFECRPIFDNVRRNYDEQREYRKRRDMLWDYEKKKYKNKNKK